MKNAVLRWADGGEQHIRPLTEEEVLLGRKGDASVVLGDPYVSRHHAKIVATGSGHELVDLGSTHGTYVNGQRVSRTALEPGARIWLGQKRVELLYELEGPETGRTDESTRDGGHRSMIDLSSVLSPDISEYSDLEKLSLLLDFQYNLGKSFSAQAMFEQILLSALKISGAERGFILLATEDDFGYVVGMDGAGNPLAQSEFVQASQTVVRQVAASGEPVFMTEGIAGDLAQQDSIVAMKLRALACVPLKWIGSDAEESLVHGILYLDSTKMMHALSGLDQKILTRLALEAGNVFEKLAMLSTLEEKKQIEKELALARETQQSLLPQKFPEVENFQVFAFSQPTRQVGGDFYDFLNVDSGILTGVLADVSGKGISAALLSSLLQGALDMEVRSGTEPAKALQHLNKFLCERSQANRFVTLFLFQLNPAGEGIFISAGHNTAYLYRASSGTVEELAPEHLILGAFDFAEYASRPLQMRKNDVLVVYSDGLTEAADPSGEMFGEQRLIELIRSQGERGAENLEMTILGALEDFTKGRAQTDDITLMLVEKTG